MKKIIIAFVAAFAFASCLPEAEFTQTVPVYANFENSGLTFDADSLFYKSIFGEGFAWGGAIGFLHKVDTATWTFEGGTLLSYQKGCLYDPADTVALSKSDSLVFAQDRFRVNSKRDSVGNNTYAVYYGNPDPGMMPAHDIEFLLKENGTCQVYQCFVNNTSYVAYKVAKTFQPSDRLTLTATGYLKGNKTGDVSINLADFSAQKDSIVSTWTSFDLSRLGAVDYIDFNVTSTKKEVPAYFCMDYLVASVTVSN